MDSHTLPITVLDDGTESNKPEEKPAEPKSYWCTPPFYIYKASDVPLVKKGIV